MKQKIFPTVLHLFFALFLSSCNTKKENASQEKKSNPKDSIVSDFGVILDSTGLSGSILIYDPQINSYFSNDFQRSSKGFLPASTFKIPNSLIALETGVVENDSTLFKWDGKKRRLQSWERDMTFREAFHASCVPCYREIAQKIGVGRMKDYLQKFN